MPSPVQIKFGHFTVSQRQKRSGDRYFNFSLLVHRTSSAAMANEQLIVVSTLAYIVSVISFLCTVMSLVLIRVMKKWNGFLAILW